MKKILNIISGILSLILILNTFAGCSLLDADLDFLFDGGLFEQNRTDSTKEQEYVTTYTDYPSIDGYTPIPRKEYYSYQQLSDVQKKAYDKMVEYAVNFDRSSGFVEGASKRDIDIAFSAVCTDYPQFFWIGNSYGYSIKENGSYFSFDNDGGFVCVKTVEERDKINLQINKTAKDIITGIITPEMTDYQKELKIHDYLCETIVYNKEAASWDEYRYDEMSNWNILGAFLNSSGVCAAYAEAFQYLMYIVGIPCTQVLGESGEAHVWNAVNLEDEWYYVDVTWDDNAVGDLEFIHSSFNINDRQLRKSKPYDHFSVAKDESFKTGLYNFYKEETTATKYNYFHFEGLIVTSANFNKTIANALTEKWDGTAATVEFAYQETWATDAKIRKDCSGGDINQLKKSGKITISYAIPAKNSAFVIVMRNNGPFSPI